MGFNRGLAFLELLTVVAGCGLSGCFGKLDTSDSGEADGTSAEDGADDDSSDGQAAEDGDGAPTDPPGSGIPSPEGNCSPAQWDCSGTLVSCRLDAEGYPVFRPAQPCRCDLTRPRSYPWDECPEGHRKQCGTLDDGEPTSSRTELSCRCVENQGYYCKTCPSLGLYSHGGDAQECSSSVCGCPG